MAEQPQPTRSGFIHQDGYDIWYEYFGDGRREAVALLNGLAMSTRAWYGFLPLLADEYDVLLYDYLGQGESSKPDAPYSITRIAQYLTAIMDELEIASAGRENATLIYRHDPTGKGELRQQPTTLEYLCDHRGRIELRIAGKVCSDRVEIFERLRRPNYVISHRDILFSASLWVRTPSATALSSPRLTFSST